VIFLGSPVFRCETWKKPRFAKTAKMPGFRTKTSFSQGNRCLLAVWRVDFCT
jgi:hypothetical protein